jgi:tetratricopeptide (TPR) repeat protein
MLGIRGRGTKYLQDAVNAYRSALGGYNKTDDPTYWAMMQFNLGRTLIALGKQEDGIKSLEFALIAFTEAMEVFTRDSSTEYWSLIQCELGVTYFALSDKGNRLTNLQKSLQQFRLALEGFLQVRDRERADEMRFNIRQIENALKEGRHI